MEITELDTKDEPQSLRVLVAGGTPSDNSLVCRLLNESGFSGHPVSDLEALESRITEAGSEPFLAAILDLDTLEVDNRTIRGLVQTFPELSLFCMSSQRVHPELREAIGRFFYACLSKPLDPDELTYLLRSVSDNSNPTQAQPP
ncbi:MAG: hypothetical protein ACOWWM_10635 [Desulfobacterales bacterium]